MTSYSGLAAHVVPSCRMHVFVATSLLSAVIDIVNDVRLQGSGVGLAHAWNQFLVLMAVVELTQHLTWYRQVISLIGSRGITPLAHLQTRRAEELVEITIVSLSATLRSACDQRVLLEANAYFWALLRSGKRVKHLRDNELLGIFAQGMLVNCVQILLAVCSSKHFAAYASISFLLCLIQPLLYFLSWRAHAAIHQIVGATDWSLMIESRFVDHSCLLFFLISYVSCAKFALFTADAFGAVLHPALSCLAAFPFKVICFSTETRWHDSTLSWDKHCNLAYVVPIVAHWWFLWRFMLGSGLCKVGGNGWWNRTALNADAHYVNQPLPSFTAWFTKLFPKVIERLSVDATFLIEVFVPFMIFGPSVVIFTYWMLADRTVSEKPKQLPPRMRTLEGRLVNTFLERFNLPYKRTASCCRDILFGACVLIANAVIFPTWFNRIFRCLAGTAFLLLMLLINTTGNFGNLGFYTASVCLLLWAPYSSVQDGEALIVAERESSLAILIISLLAVPLMYVHVGLSLEALNASLAKFDQCLHFPTLHHLEQNACSRKRKRDVCGGNEKEITILQVLKSYRITAAPNKPFSGVSNKGRTELIFEVKGERSPDNAQDAYDALQWQRVPFHFKPCDSSSRLPWLFFFPGANYWPRFDWICFFWRQFWSSHAKQETLVAFMQKLLVDDPVLDELLPLHRPRARPGMIFSEVRAVACEAYFGSEWGCMTIKEPLPTTQVAKLTSREKREAIDLARDCGILAHSKERAGKTSQGFFDYAAGYGYYSNIGCLIGNVAICFCLYVVLLL